MGETCKEAYGTEVEVLPLDMCAPFADLQKAAVRADDVFDGAGVDYLIHNAGSFSDQSDTTKPIL